MPMLMEERSGPNSESNSNNSTARSVSSQKDSQKSSRPGSVGSVDVRNASLVGDSLSRIVGGKHSNGTGNHGNHLSRSYQPPASSGGASGAAGAVGGSGDEGSTQTETDAMAAFEALELAAAAGDAVGRLMADMASGGQVKGGRDHKKAYGRHLGKSVQG